MQGPTFFCFLRLPERSRSLHSFMVSTPSPNANDGARDPIVWVGWQDLVMENLETSDKKLSLLLEPKLKLALEDYVYKQDAQVRA